MAKEKKKRKARVVWRRPRVKRRARRVKRVVRRRKPAQRKKKRLNSGGLPHYALDSSFEFLYELRDLILKSSPGEKSQLLERINKLGRIKLAIIAGIFVNRESPDPTLADLLIVGDDIDSRKLRNFLKTLEAEVGKEIKFAVMEKEEFQYRLSMFDRFIRVLLESPHEKIINKLGL